MITIVAEAGLNHGGSLAAAQAMADAAKAARADIVKFQTYDVDLLMGRDHPDYTTLAELAMSRPDTVSLSRHCAGLDIEFMSTPGDVPSLKFLVEECGVRRIKIGSDDLTNRALVDAALATGLPVILSTGMATMAEINHALEYEPDLRSPITLLQCTSCYPTAPQDVNLLAMNDLRSFGFPVGYSDHTPGTSACLAAAALGAVMIEKHFWLPRQMIDCIDRSVSISSDLLQRMVMRIRDIEAMLGTSSKEPCAAELANRARFRKATDGRRACA